MNKFKFTQTVPMPTMKTAALGASTAAPLTDLDIGKCLVMGTADNYLLAADGAEIEGFLDSVDPEKINGGFGKGGVQTEARVYAEVGPGQTGNIAVLDYVVADAQVAVGTLGKGRVKKGTPARWLWRVIRIESGLGAAGSTVLLERDV